MSNGRPPALRANSVFATTGFTSSTVACAWTSTTRTRRPPICTSRRVTAAEARGACPRPCSPLRSFASASGKLRLTANPAAAPVTVLIKDLRFGIDVPRENFLEVYLLPQNLSLFLGDFLTAVWGEPIVNAASLPEKEFQQEIGMKPKVIFVALLWLLCAVAAFGQARESGRGRGQEGGRGRGQQAAEPPATDKVTPEIAGVVKAGTKIEIVKFGLGGTDAGMGMSDGSVLVSSRGSLLKIDPDGSATTLLENTDQAAGLAIDRKGRVIAAQYSKKVSVLYPKGSEEVLTDSFDGKPYIRPNDLVVDKKGGIYFTDCYQIGATPSPNDLPQSVYYIAPNSHKVIRVASDVRRPNGITLSADDKTLYVNDWDGAYLLTYDVQPDGTLKNRKNFGKYT